MDLEATFARAEQQLLSGDPDDAMETLDAIEEIPLSSIARGRALALRATCLERSERDAEAYIMEVMKEEGDDHDFVLAAGTQFSDLDAFENAEVFLRNLIELDPENPAPPYNLAVSLGRQGRYEDSIEWYDEALRRDPELAEAHAQKGYCLAATGRAQEAAEAYRLYLEKTPDDDRTWILLAQLEEENEKIDAAYAAYERAVAVSPDPAPVYYEWAQTAARAIDPERILTCAEELDLISPGAWQTLGVRALHAEHLDDISAAWDLTRDAFDISLESQDRSEAETALTALFYLAERNAITEGLSDYISQAFDEGFLSQEVLEALLALDGRSSSSAGSYQIVLSSAWENPDDPAGDGELHYRVYGASAESPDAAIRFAKAFEKRCTDLEWEVESVQQISEPGTAHLGVYWQSDLTDRPPNDSSQH